MIINHDDREALYEDIRMLADRDGVAELLAAISRYMQDEIRKDYRNQHIHSGTRMARAHKVVAKASHEALRQGL